MSSKPNTVAFANPPFFLGHPWDTLVKFYFVFTFSVEVKVEVEAELAISKSYTFSS